MIRRKPHHAVRHAIGECLLFFDGEIDVACHMKAVGDTRQHAALAVGKFVEPAVQELLGELNDLQIHSAVPRTASYLPRFSTSAFA